MAQRQSILRQLLLALSLTSLGHAFSSNSFAVHRAVDRLSPTRLHSSSTSGQEEIDVEYLKTELMRYLEKRREENADEKAKE